MPKFYMMIGTPACGKSTWIEKNCQGFTVISSDAWIEKWAKQFNSTYGAIFSNTIKNATKTATAEMLEAFKADKDVVLDQTNLSKKVRAKKLALVPNHYQKTAVVLMCEDPVELKKRLDSRPGKTIPPHVLETMTSIYQPPDFSEGFQKIWKVKT